MGLDLFTKLFFALGALVGVIYGKKSYEFHDAKGEADQKKAKDSKWRQANQFWLHFLGFFIGWVFLYYFLVFRLHLFSSNRTIIADFYKIIADFEMTGLDFLTLLIVFVGITGYLPYATLLGKTFRSG